MSVERALTVLDDAKALQIATGDDYTLAVGFLLGVAELQKEVEEAFDPIIKKAHAAHKEAVAQKKKYYEPLVEAEQFVKRLASDYLAQEERNREIREKALREEAQLEAAIQADSEVLCADDILSGESYNPVVVCASTVPSVNGVSARKTYKFRIIDEAKIPREYLKVDEQRIGQVVRALKDSCKIPGVVVYAEDTIAVRRG